MMNIYRIANSEKGLESHEIEEALVESLDGRSLKNVLILPPDFTRYHSNAGFITNYYYHYLTDRGCNVDLLPTLGTHVPMTSEQIKGMYGDIPFEFDSEIPANLSDVYAHWIPVGTVSKDGEDDKELPDNMNSEYSGFGLFGVQIRPEAQFDQNMGEYYYGGLRFISSISESLLSDIDDLSTEKVGSNNVEYGYVTAAKSTIDTVADNADMHIDKSKYKIQYKGENVNGVDTLLNNATSEERKTPNNFRYVTNVDCTSKYDSGNGKVYGNNPRVKIDHKNFSGYRLMTFVVNYTGENAESDKGKDVVARAYIRYYDANGLLRTFYNDYGGTNVYGGCSTSFNTVKNAITGDIKTEVKK